MITSYKDLIVWQKAIELVQLVYSLTEKFPKAEIYGITIQMRRAAVSIPSNIAEGSVRGTRKDYRHFLLNAFGSGAELETQSIIAQRLQFGESINFNDINKLLTEIMKMLNALIKNLEPNP